MATTEDRSEKEIYELGYLILSSIAEEDLPKTVSKLKDIVKKAGGEEFAGEDPMKIDLAYEMSKVVSSRKYIVKDAYLGWFKFEIDPASIEAIDKEVKKMDEVLRSLIIKAPRETTFTFADAKRKEAERVAELEAAEAALENSSSEPSKEGVQ